MINEVDFGMVVKNKVPIIEEGQELVSVGQLGIVVPSMKYCSDELLIKFKWRHVVVPRNNLQAVACSFCHGYGASNATAIWQDAPVCNRHKTEKQFFELWGFLTEGELPDGVS